MIGAASLPPYTPCAPLAGCDPMATAHAVACTTFFLSREASSAARAREALMALVRLNAQIAGPRGYPHTCACARPDATPSGRRRALLRSLIWTGCDRTPQFPWCVAFEMHKLGRVAPSRSSVHDQYESVRSRAAMPDSLGACSIRAAQSQEAAVAEPSRLWPSLVCTPLCLQTIAELRLLHAYRPMRRWACVHASDRSIGWRREACTRHLVEEGRES
ncbi:Hypothetical protein MSYG_1487 [Malassezia sympodialis ATCC 42132]|uniref:Uncharacterized protein n=1 Tax=Malassezia sympodialis (strain ATCC 42132) TaxID=1230383 RepID=A0A1M8A4A6_MALS4|nr:Hypothetical protein MSYG_1487 [Malassezia sympodialis ATCC 42132]